MESDTLVKIRLKENDTRSYEVDDTLCSMLSVNLCENSFVNDRRFSYPKYLGITWNKSKRELSSDYYIGTCWLLENEVSIVVEPKIEHIDFMSLFSIALNISSQHEAEYFSHYYGIDFNASEIPVNSETQSYLTPLLISHYIGLLKLLVRKNLKKGYVYREDNLTSKVKGKILVQKNFRKNVTNKREDRCFCSFNEYTVDIPENRLLKKALIFSERVLSQNESMKEINQSSFANELRNTINKIKPYFEQVSDEITPKEVISVFTNKLYKQYKEAINVAKLILRKYDYSFEKICDKEQKTYPFWIDMPRLFEMYVYFKLKKEYSDELEFQVEGYGRGDYKTAADYILKNKRMIIDAKYKPRYENGQNNIIGDIREISGYARDIKITDRFRKTNPFVEPRCVIVYPGKSDFDETAEKEFEIDDANDSVLNIGKCRHVKGFREIYFCEISLPMLNPLTK